MSRDEGRWLGRRAAAARPGERAGDDPMERVHREFNRRNLRHAVELILASPDAEEILEELKWRLARRSRAMA